MKLHVWRKLPHLSYIQLIDLKPYSNRGRQNRWEKVFICTPIPNWDKPKRNRK